MVLQELRKFHNTIKWQILKDYTCMVSKKYNNGKPIKLLDLACGKGGDLNKWIRNRCIGSVRGYDIDEKSIKEACKRLKKQNTKLPVHFFVKDLSKYPLSGHLKYDTISIQFAFHYFFVSEASFNIVLTSILRSLKTNGILIMTLFDSDNVHNMSHPNINVKVYSKNANHLFGNRIDVFLRETVLKEPTPEYLVDKNYLINKFQASGLSLLNVISFDTFPGFQKLNIEEREFSRMNSVFVFQKQP